ncbi:GntR family transcriptional regulator [Anaerolentibacter hominis]|uniref:GntR family transcriptional regulator n=1 Tax=Anaerolentibacter hominis TaxID=3079009 RepID=UPI0031B802AC
MNDNHQFSSLIYEYFLLRIQFGYYSYGDTLPTIDTLCREFSVGAQTVKAALRRLRTEGYISMYSGQTTRILFRQTEKERLYFVRSFYSHRREDFFDLYEAGEFIFIPLHMECLRNMNDADLAYLTCLSERAQPDDLFRFYSYTLQKLNNSLALNLFWETSMFHGFPFARTSTWPLPYDAGLVQNRMQSLIAQVRRYDRDAVHNMLLDYQRRDIARLKEHMASGSAPASKEDRTPFVWRIYRDRPQLCYSLAIRILHDIYMGEYSSHNYLPSYEKISKKYGISISTVRRTITLLNQAGAAHSVNGVGTRIYTMGEQCNKPDLNSPAVRQNLALFIQAFELIVYSCEGIMLDLLNHVSRQRLNAFIDQLAGNRQNGQCERTVWHILIFIAENHPLNGIREIYSKIYGLFLWGYPLRASLEEHWKLYQARADMTFTEMMIQHLKNNDYKQCSRTFHELTVQQFDTAINYLSRQGISPEELRLSPSIRMLSTEI